MIEEVVAASSAAQLGMALSPQAGGGILRAMSQENYLLAKQPSELERLRLQSLVWEPTGRQLLSQVVWGA